MPNNVAYLALLMWPLVAIWLYKKKEVIPATFWTIVGGYLLLPVGVQFDFPLIPALNKETIPAVMVLLCCRYSTGLKIKLLPPKGIERNLILLFFAGSVGMVLTNGDVVDEPTRFIQALSYRDTVSVILSQGLLLLPFTIAIQLIRSYDDQVELFKLIVLAGLLYSILIVFEIRMSPQLHKWIYGFFPHTWAQQLRYGGFRPVVFLGHGLWVSIFLVAVLGASLILSNLKVSVTKRFNSLIVTYLVLLLYFSKGFGAMILGSIFLIVTKVIGRMSQRIAISIATLAILYPLLCIVDIFPHQYLIDLVEPVNMRQAGSLQYRFNQEALLLERATEKYIFGWGGWDRYKLPNSVTDGYWIIVFGKYGLIGFISIFGLMFTSIWKVAIIRIGLVNKIEYKLLGTHSLLLSLLMLDQLPNASINPLFWFMFGALVGRTREINFKGMSTNLEEKNSVSPNILKEIKMLPKQPGKKKVVGG